MWVAEAQGLKYFFCTQTSFNTIFHVLQAVGICRGFTFAQHLTFLHIHICYLILQIMVRKGRMLPTIFRGQDLSWGCFYFFVVFSVPAAYLFGVSVTAVLTLFRNTTIQKINHCAPTEVEEQRSCFNFTHIHIYTCIHIYIHIYTFFACGLLLAIDFEHFKMTSLLTAIAN